MKNIKIMTLAVSTLAGGICAHASSTYRDERGLQALVQEGSGAQLNGAAFVRVSRDSGYFVVEPGSRAIDRFGLQDAPVRNSDNIARNGVGSDAIAFLFGPSGKLENYPVYISQTRPELFYTRRLGVVTINRTTLADVQTLFDTHSIHVEKQGSQTIAYLEVPVYDPLSSGE